MQTYLKDILSNPPYHLGRIANFLLIVSAILLASIFFVHNDDEDIILNILHGQSAGQSEEVLDGPAQLANTTYEKLYARITEGQTVRKRDTLFTSLTEEEQNTIHTWRTMLQSHTLIPTAVMLEDSIVTPLIKEKMIALAKAYDQGDKYRSASKLNPNSIKDKRRWKVVTAIVKDLKQDVKELKSAIPKFEQLQRSMENKFDIATKEYNANNLTLKEFKRAHRKREESQLDTKQRIGQLKTAELKVREYNSELAYLNKSLRAAAKKAIVPKQDHLVFETDLMISLDSLWSESFVLSQYAGEVASIGKLENVSPKDTLWTLPGEIHMRHGSKTLFAESISREGANIYPGSDLFILLTTGEKVVGKIVGPNDTSTSERQQYEIASAEILDTHEIDEIVVPAKKGKFIEKVMENF